MAGIISIDFDAVRARVTREFQCKLDSERAREREEVIPEPSLD
jgi:hypothetical protein